MLQLISCQFYPHFVNTHRNQHLRSLMASAGYSLRFLSLQWSLGSEVSEKHICWFIALSLLFVWSAPFVTWCSFTGHWNVSRRLDTGSFCWSIWCIQEGEGWGWGITFTPTDSVHRPTPHAGAISSSGTFRRHIRWRICKCGSILLTDEAVSTLLGELGEALPDAWQYMQLCDANVWPV